MEDIKKECVANFIRDDKLIPAKYERIIPQDDIKITKSILKLQTDHPSLDNSYLTDMGLEK